MSLKSKAGKSSKAAPLSIPSKKPKGTKPKGTKQKGPRDSKGRLALGSLCGSPTLYKIEYCQKLINFSKKAEGSFRAFAALIGVDEGTIQQWAKDYPDFNYAKRVAKGLNETAMFDIGLKGMRGGLKSSAWQTAWIFAMKARHSWKEEGSDEQEEGDLEFNYT